MCCYNEPHEKHSEDHLSANFTSILEIARLFPEQVDAKVVVEHSDLPNRESSISSLSFVSEYNLFLLFQYHHRGNQSNVEATLGCFRLHQEQPIAPAY